MNLKKIIPIIAAVLVFCLIAVIVVLNTKDTHPSGTSSLQTTGVSTPSEPSGTENSTTGPGVDPEPLDPMLEECKSMLIIADAMLASGEVITVNRYECTELYLRRCKATYLNSVTYGDKTCSIDTSVIGEDFETQNPEKGEFRYFLLLTMLLDKYYDSIVQKYKFDVMNTSYMPFGTMYLCTEYQTAGYETADAFYNAVISGEYNPVSMFEFNLMYAIINQHGDAENTNLYKKIG